jgi:membrane protease YdiL (CAAX protease family)
MLTQQSARIAASMPARAGASLGRVRVPGVLLFFAITHGLMLLCGGLAALVAQGRLTLPAPPLLLVALGGLGPLLAALVATAYDAGGTGMRALLAQAVRWRVAPVWYAAALLGPALVVLAALLIDLALRAPRSLAPPLPPSSLWPSLPVLALVYVAIGLVEELGWRGYAQPALQRRCGALAASLLVGALWALWHLPQWWIPETGQAAKWPFAVFAAGTIAQSAALGWLYNRTRGSVLLVALAHAGINLAPEPWAAAWQTLPAGTRGPYPAIIVAAVWVTGTALAIALVTSRVLARRSRPGWLCSLPGSHSAGKGFARQPARERAKRDAMKGVAHDDPSEDPWPGA